MNEETNELTIIINDKKRSKKVLIKQDLKDAYIYFNGLCPYSDTPISDQVWHLEHIIPTTMGGTTDPWNCIPVCNHCNSSKGRKHLLDWWVLEHKPEEEYKLEKIFNYIIDQLNKPKNYQIATKDQTFLDKLLKEEQNIEEQDEDIIYNEEEQAYLDTFTFLYQLVNHLNSNKQYLKEDINKHIEKLNKAYNNNSQYRRLDTELFKLQNELVEYLKSIGVTQHYSIAFKYSTKISSIDEIKNNINRIKKYIHKDDISDLINKNPNIILMNEVEFSSKLEYIINILNISLNIFLERPTIINQLDSLKELYEYCINEDIDFNNIPNYIFIKRRIKEIKKIVEICKNNGITPEGTVFKRSANEIQQIVKICKLSGIEPTGSVFLKSASEIEKIVEIYKNNGIKPEGTIFTKSASDIEKIIEVCKFNKIEPNGSVFLKSASEIEKIVEICKNNGIKPEGTMFTKSAQEIQKIIEVCKLNKIEPAGSVFIKSASEIEKIIEVCKKNGIKPEGTIFMKNAEEIEKIIEVCKLNKIEPTGSIFYKSASEIQKIIKVCNDNKIKPEGTMFTKSASEIQKIIKVCNDNKIKPEGNVFAKTASEIQKIVEVCKKNGIEIKGSVFYKSAGEIQKIAEVCKKNGIDPVGNVFKRSANEIEKIVEICKKNKIEITGSVFVKKPKDLNSNIEYLKSNYGEAYLKPLLVIVSPKKIDQIFPYLDSLDVLPIVIDSASILSLTLDEIKERKQVLDYLEEPMVVGYRFNPIFGLTRKKYQKKIEGINMDSVKKR